MSVPRWELAILSGLTSVAMVVGFLGFGLGFDLGLSLLSGSVLGFGVGFLVAGWFGPANAVLSIFEISVSTLGAIAAIIVAALGALS